MGERVKASAQGLVSAHMPDLAIQNIALQAEKDWNQHEVNDWAAVRPFSFSNSSLPLITMLGGLFDQK